jgi:hypothetical protein
MVCAAIDPLVERVVANGIYEVAESHELQPGAVGWRRPAR